MYYPLLKKGLLPVLQLILVYSGLSAQSLHITAGCNFIMTGSANLVLNNMGFVNNGNFMAGNGTVQFSGNTGAGITDNSVSGTTAVFNNLVIHMS